MAYIGDESIENRNKQRLERVAALMMSSIIADPDRVHQSLGVIAGISIHAAKELIKQVDAEFDQ